VQRDVVRRCVVCRQRERKEDLCRFVLRRTKDGTLKLAVDPNGTEPGRGAYSHRSAGCLFNKRLVASVIHSLTARFLQGDYGEELALLRSRANLRDLIEKSIVALASPGAKSCGRRNKEVLSWLRAVRDELAGEGKKSGRRGQITIRL